MSINIDIIDNIDSQKINKEYESIEKINSTNNFRLQSNTRIFIKTIIFRLIALAITFSITYLYTKNYRSSLKVSIFIEFIQLISYFIYENIWNKIQWGYVITSI